MKYYFGIEDTVWLDIRQLCHLLKSLSYGELSWRSICFFKIKCQQARTLSPATTLGNPFYNLPGEYVHSMNFGRVQQEIQKPNKTTADGFACHHYHIQWCQNVSVHILSINAIRMLNIYGVLFIRIFPPHMVAAPIWQ